jgi:hypothetical protein
MLAMMLGAGIVYGTGSTPGLATHLAMLATALCTSRLFNQGLLQRIWLLTVGLIGLLLLFDLGGVKLFLAPTIIPFSSIYGMLSVLMTMLLVITGRVSSYC